MMTSEERSAEIKRLKAIQEDGRDDVGFNGRLKRRMVQDQIDKLEAAEVEEQQKVPEVHAEICPTCEGAGIVGTDEAQECECPTRKALERMVESRARNETDPNTPNIVRDWVAAQNCAARAALQVPCPCELVRRQRDEQYQRAQSLQDSLLVEMSKQDGSKCAMCWHPISLHNADPENHECSMCDLEAGYEKLRQENERIRSVCRDLAGEESLGPEYETEMRSLLSERKSLRSEVERLTRDRDISDAAAHRLLESNAEFRAEIKQLRAAVQNQCGDNLCWVEDVDQAKALPEAEFLESCRRYRNQIAEERGELQAGQMTIAQLEAELVKLKSDYEKVYGWYTTIQAELADVKSDTEPATDGGIFRIPH